MTTVTGYVYLVGTGPGDLGSVTTQAIQVIRRADIILYDFLVHPTVRQYQSPTAHAICVGKKRGVHSETQQTINRLMIDYAMQGHCVVRLKGGTPTVFGRGGEEMDALQSAGIAFEIVPGVSSVFGVLERAGIPVTHRDYAHSVGIVSGAAAKTGTWQGHIPDADTIIAVMAVKTIQAFATSIITMTQHTASTPAAIIYRGTLSDETVIITQVGQLHTHSVDSPALVVVGPVVTRRLACRGYRTGSLQSHRIINLRPQNPLRSSAAVPHPWDSLWQQAGADVIAAPALTIQSQPLPPDYFVKHGCPNYSVFTSPIAVDYFVQYLAHYQKDWRALHHTYIVSVGRRTTDAIQRYGMTVNVQAPASIESQSGILAQLPDDLSGHTVLWPRSNQAAPVLATTLRDRGARLTGLDLYTTVPVTSYPIRIRPHDHIIFTSPRLVHAFFKYGPYTPEIIVQTTAWYWGEQTRTALVAQADRFKSQFKSQTFAIKPIDSSGKLGR